jgi:hypothetical protein
MTRTQEIRARLEKATQEIPPHHCPSFGDDTCEMEEQHQALGDANRAFNASAKANMAFLLARNAALERVADAAKVAARNVPVFSVEPDYLTDLKKTLAALDAEGEKC